MVAVNLKEDNGVFHGVEKGIARNNQTFQGFLILFTGTLLQEFQLLHLRIQKHRGKCVFRDASDLPLSHLVYLHIVHTVCINFMK